MPRPTQRMPYGPNPPVPDRAAIDQARRWLDHLEAGRVGLQDAPDAGLELRHLRNGMILRGDPLAE
jgi:hypothetical protein